MQVTSPAKSKSLRVFSSVRTMTSFAFRVYARFRPMLSFEKKKGAEGSGFLPKF